MPLKRQLDVVFSPIMRSAGMKAVEKILRAVAGKEVTLTLLGESGSGKEVIARRAHELSDRRKGPFVPINCAAIPETLFESELFGHERGAFTGANERTQGKVGAAEHGTLFLDEIGELPMAMQAKLLRFLEGRRYTRLGSSKKIDADVRLVCATLRPLEAEVARGRFRADLFYRIQGITLEVPPLRERRADILPLLSLFTSQLSARHDLPPPKMGRHVKACFLEYGWPGNVRELRNVVETLCLLRAGRHVRPQDLPRHVQPTAPADDVTVGATRTRAVIEVDVNQGLEAGARRIVSAALTIHRGNKVKAAKQLGISVRTIQRYVASGSVSDAQAVRGRSRPA